jgi:hypothetical protein
MVIDLDDTGPLIQPEMIFEVICAPEPEVSSLPESCYCKLLKLRWALICVD